MGARLSSSSSPTGKANWFAFLLATEWRWLFVVIPALCGGIKKEEDADSLGANDGRVPSDEGV
jgi:hypothetical protein